MWPFSSLICQFKVRFSGNIWLSLTQLDLVSRGKWILAMDEVQSMNVRVDGLLFLVDILEVKPSISFMALEKWEAKWKRKWTGFVFFPILWLKSFENYYRDLSIKASFDSALSYARHAANVPWVLFVALESWQVSQKRVPFVLLFSSLNLFFHRNYQLICSILVCIDRIMFVGAHQQIFKCFVDSIGILKGLI